MNESANNVFIHQRAPAARTYRVCIRKLSLITPTGHTALVRPVGVYIAQSVAFLFVGIPKMPMAETACVMKSSTHTMPYLHPSIQWMLIIFSRSDRNSAYNPHALPVMLFCTSCLSAYFKCRLIFIEITSNVLRLSLCYRNVKR